MTTTLNPYATDPHAARYWEDLESALMAKTIEQTTSLPEERRRALLRLWVRGTFDAAAAGLESLPGSGVLVWNEGSRTTRDLVYHAPYGLACPLGRVYRQPDGTWAALVIAGVGCDEYEAMAKAEWGISRLTAQ